MSTSVQRFLLLTAFLAAAFTWPASSRPAETTQDETALMKNAEAFVEAFQKGDAKALAALWTPDGDYVDQNGKTIKGRQAIEEAFQAFFKEHKGMKLRIDITSLRFASPEMAIEDGISQVIPPDGAPPSAARYTNVHVKKGTQWLLSGVRVAPYVPPSNFDQLRALEGIIGDWASDAGKGEVSRVSFAWGPGQNYIDSTHTVAFKDVFLNVGTQKIAWDPAAKRIRSWNFEADGGFGEGAWTKDGDKWVIKTNSVLPDGGKLSATNYAVKVDANTISWQSKERTLDGKPLPDSAEIKLKRVK
jgi:uncharacterized protein (TIGR02246 family)